MTSRTLPAGRLRIPAAMALAAAAVGPCGGAFCAEAPAPAASIFSAGEGGYRIYRIPALLATAGGTVLAFCEGRVHGAGDSGDIDLLVRRSRDGGAAWDPQHIVWNDGADTCGNPCPVQDRETGVVWLLMTWNLGTDAESRIIAGTSAGTRRVFVSSSRDEGATWEAPREITAAVKRPDWTWYATGPCTGIQLRRGKFAGRLLVPCDHIEAGTKKYYSHVIYSDDHGASWKLGGRTPADQVNECQAVELPDGRIMLNMRNYDRRMHSRAVAVSGDGGATWSEIVRDEALVEPICQASLIAAADAGGNEVLLFSNPAHASRRVRMTVRLSRDGGATWPAARLLHEGPAAYSSLAVLPGGDIGCLYECGEKGAYERIALARFSLAWLSEGRDGAAADKAALPPPPPAPKGAVALPRLRKLMDTPLRDTSICRGPDGAWYLTGTVEPFWAYNEGIKVWRSKDLAAWEPLGMVWRYGESPWHAKYLEAKKPLWAPEIHYLKGTFWLTYSIPGWDGTAKTSGCGLLKSTSGAAAGPYEDVQPGERMGDEIDASLFEDDDGAVYFLWHSGKIARMTPDMRGLAEPYRWLKTTVPDPNPAHHSGLCPGIFGAGSFDHVGYEGMCMFKANGRYYLGCADACDGRYSCYIAEAPSIGGPYGARYEALPHAGHNVFFKDERGAWWSTYFGSDDAAPWRERPGILPIRFDEQGRVRPE